MRELAHKRVLVVGMGESGVAAAAFLKERGAVVASCDSRSIPEADLPQTPAAVEGRDLIVQSPGVPLELPLFQHARELGIPVIGELELAAEDLQGPVIGITGANGKTTTTALVGHILRESGIDCQVGGNIGTPVTAMVASSRPGRWNVLELSSFQLETIETFRADISAVLNITPDHLDRHFTMENYVAAKARLVETQRPGDFCVLNAGDPVAASLAARTKAEVIWFNESDEIRIRGRKVDVKLAMRGRHNIENAMAAANIASLAGAKDAAIVAAAATFPGVEHRIEFVRERGGVAWYNDSKATNVDAAQKALDSFEGRLWVILGGKDKSSDYTALASRLSAKAKKILLIGMAAPIIRRQLNGDLPLLDCGTIDEAVRVAAREAEAGDTVLLAPACASFDQFQSYEHRGRVFKELVNSL